MANDLCVIAHSLQHGPCRRDPQVSTIAHPQDMTSPSSHPFSSMVAIPPHPDRYLPAYKENIETSPRPRWASHRNHSIKSLATYSHTTYDHSETARWSQGHGYTPARRRPFETANTHERDLGSGLENLSQTNVELLLYHSDQLGLSLSSGGPPAGFLAGCHRSSGVRRQIQIDVIRGSAVKLVSSNLCDCSRQVEFCI